VWELRDGSRQLLYDFTLNVGDAVPGHESIHVSAIDTLRIKSVYYRRLSLADDKGCQTYWVEGIGSSAGLLVPLGDNTKDRFSMMMQFFESCQIGGIRVFTMPDFTMSLHEYIDPQTGVSYVYDPKGNTAAVRDGEFVAFDGIHDTYFNPGSPDAKGNVVIVDKVSAGGRDYEVTGIGRNAFVGLPITSVDIPSSVREIGIGAFSYCPLESVTCRVDKPFEIGYIGNCSKTTLYVPAGCKPNYEATKGWNQFRTIREIGDV
jgi:hypothetical protein